MPTIQFRTDEDTKEQATEIFQQLGITMSDAINMFLRQTILHGGLPFEVKVPGFSGVNRADTADIWKDVEALPPFNQEDLYRAEDVNDKAWQTSDPKKRVELAKKALKISPYCVDAYNVMARATDIVDKRIDLYQKGIEVGAAALGEDFFKECVGGFWGITETRPYMRSMFGLADCLWKRGERLKSIDIRQEMLRLNPNDNQGVRYTLINNLIAEKSFEAAEKLLADYDENTAFLLYSQVLLYFVQGKNDEAQCALKKAFKENSHVPEYLLSPQKIFIPKSEVELRGYQTGHESESDSYRELAGEVWRETPGALDWLKSNLPTVADGAGK